MRNDPVSLQRSYYESTASSYDSAHLTEGEHDRALEVIATLCERDGVLSVLDVGAGTGRAMLWLRSRLPEMAITGIEPVEALRKQGYGKGIPVEDLIEGDGYQLPFPSQTFDLVCAFGVMHHVRWPERIISEMTRVASKMVCISDSNFTGQGPLWLRPVKCTVFSLGLWPLANWIKTRGRGYIITDGDGVSYSYSVFQSLPDLRRQWPEVQMIGTVGGNGRMSSPHALIVARREPRRAAGPEN